MTVFVPGERGLYVLFTRLKCSGVHAGSELFTSAVAGCDSTSKQKARIATGLR